MVPPKRLQVTHSTTRTNFRHWLCCCHEPRRMPTCAPMAYLLSGFTPWSLKCCGKQGRQGPNKLRTFCWFLRCSGNFLIAERDLPVQAYTEATPPSILHPTHCHHEFRVQGFRFEVFRLWGFWRVWRCDCINLAAQLCRFERFAYPFDKALRALLPRPAQLQALRRCWYCCCGVQDGGTGVVDGGGD